MVSAILAARHRTFVLVVTSLFVLFVSWSLGESWFWDVIGKLPLGYHPYGESGNRLTGKKNFPCL